MDSGPVSEYGVMLFRRNDRLGTATITSNLSGYQTSGTSPWLQKGIVSSGDSRRWL